MTTKPYIQHISLAADITALRQGALSLETMIDQIQARFEEIEPAIQAFLPEVNRFERLRQDVEELEAQFPEPATRPPLYGALLGVKDIFHVDGYVTRAGTLVPPELFAGEEATVVTRLKRAGALILGKTVTTEFAYFEPGPTRNPHNLEHTPGGSSSGSAAAVASGLTHFSTGTQTVGSVIRPAAYCGIVGFKPSYDRVPSAGLVYFSPSADHVGFFTADLPDMQAVAATVVDDWDSNTLANDRPILAVPEGAYLQQSTALDVFEAQLYVLEQAGYCIKRIGILNDIDRVDSWHQDLIAAELAHQHSDWFASHGDLYRTRTAELIRYGQIIAADRLLEAREHRLSFRQSLHQAMEAEEVDLWLCPSAPDIAPRGLDATGSPQMNMPWTHAGLPAISIPAGRGMLGLPLGLQLVGRYWDDEKLLSWAAEIARQFS